MKIILVEEVQAVICLHTQDTAQGVCLSWLLKSDRELIQTGSILNSVIST